MSILEVLGILAAILPASHVASDLGATPNGMPTPALAKTQVPRPLVIVTPNQYVADGTPTGFAGTTSYSGGKYTASALGDKAEAGGTATFKFKWQKGSMTPEPAPLSVVLAIRTTAISIGSPAGSADNGWWPASGGTQPQVTTSATEYVVKSSPGDSFSYTVSPSAKAGTGSGASAIVTASIAVYPVEASVSGVVWFGTPKAPHILVGQKATAGLAVAGLPTAAGTELITDFGWTITGTTFKNYDPLSAPPIYEDGSTLDLDTASPTWHWASDKATATVTATGKGKVHFPTNVYEPQTADITDDFALTLDRPSNKVGNLRFSQSQPWIAWINPNGVQMAQIGTDVAASSGTVSQPSDYTVGGSYGFVQKIVSSTRCAGGNPLTVSDALDGTFPYAFSQQLYALNATARFSDGPRVSAVQPPLSADDSFEVTIVFKSSAQDAQWVPIAKATWGWTATYDPANTVIPGFLGSRLSTDWADTKDFPVWSSVQNLN